MKKMVLLVSLLTLVAFFSLAVAQQKPAPAPAAPAATAPAPAPEKPKVEKKAEKPEKVAGAIEKVDEMGKAIVVKGKTLVVDDKTKITKAGKDVPFADLKKDMQVAAEYKKVGDKMIAATIKVEAPKAAPKKEATPKEPGP